MKNFVLVATLLFTTFVSAQVKGGTDDKAAADRFGQEIARAFNERDAKALASLIDMHAFGLRVARMQGLPESRQEEFASGLASTGPSRMFASYLRILDESQGSAQFMRVTNATPARPLIRFSLGANGYDYIEYVLETRQGRTRAVDWFQLSKGELVSFTVGGIGQMFTTSDPGLLGRLFGTKAIDQQAINRLRAVGDLQREGKFAEALATLQQLPDQIANSRAMLTAQASLAMLAKQEAEYRRVLAKLAERHADDPATAFMLIDHYFTSNDLPNMLRSLDTIEKRVGADGVTRQLRATAYSAAGDHINGLKCADESIRLEPDRLDGHNVRANALIGLGRYANAVAEYRDIEKKFEVQFKREDFADPGFAKFAASPEFKAWLRK